jgi:hypothetical protein
LGLGTVQDRRWEWAVALAFTLLAKGRQGRGEVVDASRSQILFVLLPSSSSR